MLWQLRCTWELLTVPLLQGVGQSHCPQTTTVDQSRATSQVATSRSSNLLTSQGLFFLSRERLSWSLCHLCPSQPRTGAGIPPWCLLYFCLQGTTVWACLTTTRLTYLGVKEMTPLSPLPCIVTLFCLSQGPASTPEPFAKAPD